MTIIQSIILGIVEGITEFLPISSTGHMILASKVMGLTDTDFLKSFEIIVQLGAILAVVVLYWKRFFTNKDAWEKVLTAFLPTAIVGFLLYKVLKKYLLGNDVVVLWAMLLGGIALIAFEMWHVRRSHQEQPLDYKNSFLVGLAQSLAIIPGVSRSAATIVDGLIMGISRQAIVEFSFLLAIPTMAAASGYDLLKNGASFSGSDFYLLAVGFITSFIVALLAIKWFIGYIKNHSFVWFGAYRIFAAIVFYLLIFQLKI
jgi:undecaprenyl-diphosphatase